MEVKKIGVIAGSGFSERLFKVSQEIEVAIEHGTPSDKFVFGRIDNKEVYVLARHGKKQLPPHAINHKANIAAFKKLGVGCIISINSVGSLKKEIVPSSIVVPDDFICFWQIATFFDKTAVHTSPGLDDALRRKIISAGKKLKLKIVEKGIYVHTLGPRFETKAEINMFKDYADIVGMTMAHEATLAKELEIPYANISSVDNYANGILNRPVSEQIVRSNAAQNQSNVKKLVLEIIKNL